LKKVNDGERCAFLTHIGKGPNSAHKFATRCLENLKNQLCHIEKVVKRQTIQEIQNNRLRIKASIDIVCWLTFQACAFREHHERLELKNRGNFLEMMELLASYNEQIGALVLGNAPQNAKYISHQIQKEILHVFARNVQSSIRHEIGDARFFLIVDEARDESGREQMALVIKFIDRSGFIREQFLDIVHVKNTTAATLKEEISFVLSHHNLDVQIIRGQGYDGASNMRGEWNGLQALFINYRPYAYYVHCFAHQLQLALIAAAREISDVHTFFQNLIFIINIVSASCKRNDELQAFQATTIEHLVDIDEIEMGKGVNQVGGLQ
jgi:hypothetical protein